MSSICGRSDHPLRIFVFDSPRTQCQVFYKLFSQHPQLGWGKSYHSFVAAALYGPDRLQKRLRHGETAEEAQIEWGTQHGDWNKSTYESSVKELQKKIDETEDEGKIFFGKEHLVCLFKQDIMIDTTRSEEKDSDEVRSNPTYIPDAILDTLTPVFVFRHPMLMVPSLYRAQSAVAGLQPDDEDFEVEGTLRWCQMLYDYFVYRGVPPALVEAQDLVYNFQPTMNKLCSGLGIDPEGVKDTWDPVPKEHWPDDKITVTLTGALLSSSGLERRSKEPAEVTIDLDTETEKWSEAFGDAVAAGLRKRVEAEMPIYEYLRRRRLRA
ncbi:hypothetical protein LTR37_001088 [Vermiconidia calcicola]|uniref:Uncharacterized protein n=1 Tax=Vermiconidia calcicola TaxID=1690605 RepID=A0ACC3NZG8_9PEZI|nr:hypothetical protein LTR37_001088 [Vermiconidia calcicola]